MSQQVVITSYLNHVLVGILEKGRLVEFFMEKDEESRTVGNIYLGKVENILPGMEAAFVDIGLERNAFLYAGDLNQADSDLPINKLLRKGEQILVQVTKEPEGTKGARVTSQLSIPGRYLVLMPMENNIGVSRQIVDSKERERLKDIAERIKPGEMGLIIRTLAAGHSEEELIQDRDYLVALWDELQAKTKASTAPKLIYHDYDLIHRILRDLVSEDTEQVLVEQEWIYNSIIAKAKSLGLPESVKIDLFQGKVSLFEQLGLDHELEKAMRKQVWLNSGGYLIIDQTEALVSIDVNTGKYVGQKELRNTVLQTNLEAAAEIAKQLRLRNIGGIIIIDFIDMDNEADKKTVLEALETALAKDKTKSHVFGFTQLGLVEMTRKKSKQRLSNLLLVPCSHCKGRGQIYSQEITAIHIAQRIFSLAKEPDIHTITVDCHPFVAVELIGEQGSNLDALKKQIKKEIIINTRRDLELDQIKVAGHH